MAVPPQQTTQTSDDAVSDKLLPEANIVREVPQCPHQLDQDAAAAVRSGQGRLQGDRTQQEMQGVRLCAHKQGHMHFTIDCIQMYVRMYIRKAIFHLIIL